MSLRSEPDPVTGQPVGLPVDVAPAQPPGPVTLEGRYGRVERLGSRHAADLWKVYAGHDHIWTYMSSYGPFADAGAFSRWFASRLTLDDPYSYAVVDPGGRALGIATLMEIRPAMRVIEIGHIVYSPALQKRPLGPRRNICSPDTRSKHSATGATSGNATRSTPLPAARRCATVSYMRALCAST